jgi:2-polyprenyl-3-methyl-5-hydroxy-6-metoxy-1,4-benzoquinol methylase
VKAIPAIPIVFYLIKVPYWGIVRIIINYWGKRGLHSITVGEFVGGTTKTRSMYREEMLLRTMILFINIRGKSCLDLACSDGFWSFRLARFGLKSVTGLDVNSESIVRANFLKYVYDFPTFRFKQQDIFEFLNNDNKSKSYDIVLLLSIIYHLPEKSDWYRFFGAISQINNECLIIDSRWFEDDAYWYDKTSAQAVIKTKKGIIGKWRPLRKQVFDCLSGNGYEQVIEINPSAFLLDSKEAYGNGDPYTLENVSDYITNNRTLVIAYKKKAMVPNIQDRLSVKYL